MPEIMFSKKELQIWDFQSFIFWSKIRFWGTSFRIFYLIFRCRPTMVANIFTQPPPPPPHHHHNKKASYGPAYNRFPKYHVPYTAQNIKFSIEDFFSKCDQSVCCGFGHITEDILDGKLQFLCCVILLVTIQYF